MVSVENGSVKKVKLSVGDHIRDNRGIQYRVERVIAGRGSQNLGIFILESSWSKKYVLKLLINTPRGSEEYPLISKWNNILNLLGNPKITRILGADDENGSFKIPLSTFEDTIASGGDVFIVKGYIMEFAEGEALTGPPFDYPYDNKLLVCRRLSGLMRRLHGAGYNFKDLSFGNIICDPRDGRVHIIDCDNVQLNTTRKGSFALGVDALGTEWNIAPELIYSECKHNRNSDSYSLGCILFYYLVSGYRNNSGEVKVVHQYDGPLFRDFCGKIGGCLNLCEFKENSELEDIKDSLEHIRFIFDPKGNNDLQKLLVKMETNIKNVPSLPFDDAEKKSILENLNSEIDHMKKTISAWDSLNIELKQLFLRTFSDPLETHRPTSRVWENEFIAITRSLTWKPVYKVKKKTTKPTSSGHSFYCTFNGVTFPLTENKLHRNDIGLNGDFVILETELEGDRMVLINRDPILSFAIDGRITFGNNARASFESKRAELKNGFLNTTLVIEYR